MLIGGDKTQKVKQLGKIALLYAEDLTVFFVAGIDFIPSAFRDFGTLAAEIATPDLV